MSSYLDKPTLDERLEAYKQSEDFLIDISVLQNEYQQNGWPMPSEDELRAEALKNQKEWIENYGRCETEGHAWQEDQVDGENGRSRLECTRCGLSHTIQW